MKKLIAGILLMAGCFSAAQAQKPGEKKEMRGEKHQEKMLKEMTEKLTLTPDQQTKIKPILAETGEKMKANREKYKGNNKCMRQACFQARKATEEKIMAVLTPDQQKKFQEEKKRKMEERRKKKEAELSKPIECK
jgi:periplasmic protein CpxP/Spy